MSIATFGLQGGTFKLVEVVRLGMTLTGGEKRELTLFAEPTFVSQFLASLLRFV